MNIRGIKTVKLASIRTVMVAAVAVVGMTAGSLVISPQQVSAVSRSDCAAGTWCGWTGSFFSGNRYQQATSARNVCHSLLGTKWKGNLHAGYNHATNGYWVTVYSEQSCNLFYDHFTMQPGDWTNNMEYYVPEVVSWQWL